MVSFATRAVLAVSLSLAAGMGATAQDRYETTEIADGVYQFRWMFHNAMFVTTDDGVVVFDTIGADAARQLAAEIQRTAPGSPLAGIVYSHSDADHATGAAALVEAMGQTGVPIIAHELAVEPIEARASADQPAPTITFADKLRFQTGGRWIELHYLGPSHIDNIAVGYIPDVAVAFAVDFVSNDRPGYQDLATWHFPEFFDAVSGLLGIPFETIIFGHGPPGDRTAIQRQIAYYDDLTAAVRDAVANGLTEDEAAESVRLDAYAGWSNYDQWFPLNVRGVYRWLAGDGGR